jgi:Asp-tRNA(Asn)/Glu-tRNA(Gln) amidotransferase A subunit family amidase
VQRFGAPLPVGMQVMCGGYDEMKMLSIVLAMEQAFGRPAKPDVAPFRATK